MRRLHKLLIGQYAKLFENSKSTVLITVFSKLLSLVSFRRYRYIRIFNNQTCYKRTVVAENSEGYCVEPLEFDKGNKLVKKSLYSIGVSVFESESLIHSTSSLVLLESGLYHQEYHFEHSKDRVKLNSSLVVGNSSSHALISMRVAEKTIKEGVFLGGYWYANWYHWLIEILSKITILEESNVEIGEVPFLVPLRIKNMENHFQILKNILPSNNIIFIEDNKWTTVNRLIWIDSPVIFTPNFKGKRNEFDLRDFNFHFNQMKIYQSRLLKVFENVNYNGVDRVFLARKNDVRGYNQNEIIEVAKRYKFEIIYPEKLSVNEQVSIFKMASFIIGPTGAAWTNIIFCKSNTKGLIWLPDLARNVPTYSNLAYLSKISLYHLYFDSNYDDWIEFKTKRNAFYLDPIQFESTLNRLFEN